MAPHNGQVTVTSEKSSAQLDLMPFGQTCHRVIVIAAGDGLSVAMREAYRRDQHLYGIP